MIELVRNKKANKKKSLTNNEKKIVKIQNKQTKKKEQKQKQQKIIIKNKNKRQTNKKTAKFKAKPNQTKKKYK